MKIMLNSSALVPERAHENDAGLDIKAPHAFCVPANGNISIDTGVAIEIPRGYFGKLESKSGLNVKHNVVSLGGVIDSGYTGTIVAKLYNFGDKDYTFSKGDKIIQLVIQPCLIDSLEVAESFKESERGANGFGSSGN